MKQFFKDLFNDQNSINEKAVIGFLAFVMMCIFAIADIVTGTLKQPLVINEFIFDSLINFCLIQTNKRRVLLFS
jgi:hypothetical protein